ncbi:MAG: leucine-rich repeat protein [Muribaculaceae bacterium]|nr:leucine-rich repeat protein [Muribaculaceae bacterium]
MKNFYKILFSLLVLCLAPQLARAYDFILGGIAYEVVPGSNMVNVVSLPQQGENYPGLAVAQIPASLTLDGIPMTVSMISQGAFAGAKSLVMVSVPSSVTYIGDRAFYNCQSLVNVTFASGLIAVGDNAFAGCVRLSAVALPSTVITLGANVFNGCSAMKSVTLSTSLLTVGEGLLDGCSSLSALTLPSSLTELPARMARGCTSVKTVAVPNSVTTIGASAFDGCTALATLTLGNAVETIGGRAFFGAAIKTVKIPNATTSIGNAAFQNCASLASLTLGNNVARIGNYAFDGTIVKSLSLPSTLSNIGAYAFQNLPIKSLSVPDKVQTIGDGAFMGCSGLTALTLPASVTSVGAEAFAGCEGFDHVRVLATTVPASGANMLGDYNKVVIVPTAAKSAYAQSAYWGFYDVASEQEWSGGRDCNSDGMVDVGDVNLVLADILAGGKTQSLDVNNDGKVDVGDVNSVLEYILSGEGALVRILPEDKEYTVNGVKFKMKGVQGGVFMMGQEGVATPVHQVKVPDFHIGETEVTEALWTAVMGTNPSYYARGATHPVDNVSWGDCQTFITKLNELTGETFRLPTEAEWEFAARGGTKSEAYQYAGSNEIDKVAWYSRNSGNVKHPVATKAANELGLYDMSGNVAEWCQDWLDNYSNGAVVYPTGPTMGSSRVARGGRWNGDAEDCRVSNRLAFETSYWYRNLGLRLAR